MLVERPVYEEAISIAARIANATRVGDPAEPGPHLGPVVSGHQFARIQEFINSGITEGARLVAGGPERPEGWDRGYFVRPTIFAGREVGHAGCKRRNFRSCIMSDTLRH